jgi:hypothetical protein
MILLRRLVPLVVALCASLVSAPAGAWGQEGHRIVAAVAEQLLDARTRAAYRALAGDESLEDASTWLDRERQSLRRTLRGSPAWHYDDRPVCDERAALSSYCPNGDCASRAYDRYLARLSDRNASREQRLLALHVVVHLLGDAHQPLHAADHADRGGNQVEVLFGQRRRAKPLHSVWDSDFVKRAVRGSSEQAFAERLIEARRANIPQLERGGFAAWQLESYTIARDFTYGRLPGFDCASALRGPVRLPYAYVEGARPIVEERLARAGIRLAAVLRAAL